ncbi:hypothetical protein NUW54_g7089 [Trametes sanguinea]|uniref:Uncharacterized protein n=1 Tax=Trametes sanguinea TaxID=158606 RepID=A0ACC1PNY1_9APHY|nr:hypothetical protein NUW54_g7089 [Trametes sanguinea]
MSVLAEDTRIMLYGRTAVLQEPDLELIPMGAELDDILSIPWPVETLHGIQAAPYKGNICRSDAAEQETMSSEGLSYDCGAPRELTV